LVYRGMTIIPNQRHRFDMARDVHYLNCAYMSPLSDTVRAALSTGAAKKAQPWTYKPADFFGLAEDFRSSAATLLGTQADNIAIIPSVSYALAVAAKNLPLKAGQSVVVLADQFPSNLYIWRERAKETGADIATVQRDVTLGWTAAVLDAISPNTAIVAVPHNHWADGGLLDLVAIGEKCRSVGAALVLDLTQSLGALPFDIASVQPDFCVSACYKWMMGPYGIGALYVAPKYHKGQPIEHNWVNRAGAQDFSRLTDYTNDFQPGARRYDMGEKSNPPLLLAAKAGIDMLIEWGVDAVSATLAAKTNAIADAARGIGIIADDIGMRAPHFLSLRFSDGVPDGLTDRLASANVFVSLRGTSLRVTPHVYNDYADSAALIAALKG
jgi:selenocysteine lyase/cysteine desulfurase